MHQAIRVDNIGEFFDGHGHQDADGRKRVDSLLIENGRIREINPSATRSADVVIDAHGGAVLPGLVDGHVHPVGGDWTPVQNAIGWVNNYLHGGTTTMISAGELHFPGLDVTTMTTRDVVTLVELLGSTNGGRGDSGVDLKIGTLLLVPGLTDDDFDRVAAVGSGVAKFLFFPFGGATRMELARHYVAQCHTRKMVTKVHTGGVSRSGLSVPVDAACVIELQPDIAGHVSGGPIPMADDDLQRLVREASCALELCSSMNYRASKLLVDSAVKHDQLHRIILGTDTPGGTGVIPRGMFRNITFLTGICGLSASDAIAAATYHTARAHGLDVGTLDVGAPADLIIAGPVQGSSGSTFTASLERGDLPGVSLVMSDGVLRSHPRTNQMPPPRVPISVKYASD